MNEKEKLMTDDYEKMLPELQALATRYSVSRVKLSTLNFDREFRQGVDGNLQLVSTKAVIRVLGKTTKVPIGEGEEFSTYEQAFEATKNHWSEYYKTIRANRSPEQLAAEARRQKRYRERRKKSETQLKRQQ
jgi:hypothetical protein